MLDNLCIIGHPSYVGGADTELLDQIKVWHHMGVKIHICHTDAILHPSLKKMQLEEKYDVTYLKVRRWNECKDMHCISFCNGQFLENIEMIKKFARSTTFLNCMTWNFPLELKATARQQIDFHLYQTDHGLERVSKKLLHFPGYKPLRFDPYFDKTDFPYYGDRPNDHFRFGRISRDDGAKWDRDQIEIYDSFKSPVPKSGCIVGWGNNGKMKMTGIKIPKHIQVIDAGKASQQQFYQFCDVLCMSAETFENLPRVGFEAMASGSVLVVDNRGGWTLQVENGKTGFLCDSTEDFIKNMTLLAKKPAFKERLRHAAYTKLDDEWGMKRSIISWEKVFKEWLKI